MSPRAPRKMSRVRIILSSIVTAVVPWDGLEYDT